MQWTTFFISLLVVPTLSLIDNIGESKTIIEPLHPNVTIISGQKAMLTCTFGGINRDLSLSSSHQLIWIRQSHGYRQADSILAHNQDLLISDSRLNVQRTDIDYSLTISAVTIDDEGTYVCEVNTQPPQQAFIQLHVLEIPTIVDNATSSPIIVAEHDNVTMECQARGRPTPYVTWFRRDGGGNRNQTAALTNNTDGQLHFINVSRHQSGHYECRASNGVNGHVVSKDIELRILFMPSIRAQLSVVYGTTGKPTHLRCSAAVPFDASLHWRRIDNNNNNNNNNSNQNTNDNQPSSVSSQPTRFRQQQHTHGDLLHTTLFIKDLEKSDFGLYGCFAESSAGRSQAVIELREHRRASTTLPTTAGIANTIQPILMQQIPLNEPPTTTISRAQLLKRNKVSEQTPISNKSISATSAAVDVQSSLFYMVLLLPMSLMLKLTCHM